MAKLTLTAFVSLDGVHQGPGGPQEDTRDGFTQGGWTVPYSDDESGRFVSDLFDRVGAFLLGRRTYDIFAAYWPRVTDPQDPIAGPLNRLPKYVPSTTLTDPAWARTTVLGGDLTEEVGALKNTTDGELQVHGSAVLAQSLLARGLVDTIHLLTFPVVLGAGRRLFAEGALPTAFRHEGGRITARGVSIQTYGRVGRPEYGEFPLPESALPETP
ncbi:dihydrofolate reductase family protein [Streptomyces sp. NPDC088789]|uniref:dihydrofolate reductase family protein n=1 Tax=Streptomyces sp. NPDC088789 TaxID=3365899 RepID=UPI0038215EA7